MANIMGAPDRYIQGPWEIGRLHEYGSRLGNEFLIVAEEQTMATCRRPGSNPRRQCDRSPVSGRGRWPRRSRRGRGLTWLKAA
jgi:hypothetical protein